MTQYDGFYRSLNGKVPLAQEEPGIAPTAVLEVQAPKAGLKLKKKPPSDLRQVVMAGYGCLDYEKPGVWERFGNVGRPD